MLKPDPTRFPRVVQSRINGPEWVEPDSGENAAEAREVLEFHHPEELPADLALDLRLHEMLEEALMATAATGAVIALASGDQVVCRATAGEKSPKTGVYLNTHSGLSGLCIQTHEIHRCDDALTDPRVNVAACRDLDIRSILVLPVLAGEKLWGILEAFSSVPQAFGDRDVEELRGLCRKVARTVRKAVQGETAMSDPYASFSTSAKADQSSPEIVASEIVRASTQLATASRRRDYRTGALTAAVIGLALLLGWMVGRVGWSMAVNRSQTQLPMAPEEVQAVERVTPDTPPAAPPGAELADVVKPAPSSPVPPAPAKPVSKPKAQPAEMPGSLVVYENGKVVFRMDPPAKSPSSGNESVPVQGATAQEQEEDASGVPDQTSTPTGKSYLLERVEPEYPEDAKEQHIQGPVVLNALVNRDGSVREVKVVSGSPQLVNAAANAVRQWRFRPHRIKGQPIEFETQITVNFQLP